MRSLLPRILPIFLALWVGARALGQTTLDAIGVTRLRLADPTLIGTGVRVAQPEAPEAANAWQVRPGAVGQPESLFTWSSASGTATTFPNAVGVESGHADLVGDFIYGRTIVGNPEGVAYGVARVLSYEANHFYNSVIDPNAALDARVVNQSFIYGTQDSGVDQEYDTFIASRNIVIVSGVGNGGPPSSPATSFNNIGVGAYGGASSPGPTTDGRSKPDLVAPAGATSFSTPLVSGAAALLVQAALRGDGGAPTAEAAETRTIKALLLNGAVKPQDWAHTATAPLDPRHGAGVLHVWNSYEQLRGGKHAAGGTFSTPASWSGWARETLIGNPEAIHHYTFTLSAAVARRYDATITLVWQRNFNETAIKNLDLALHDTATGAPVPGGLSTSTVDNVEHLHCTGLPPGTYDLRVIKRATQSLLLPNETYALAFRLAPREPVGVRIVGLPMGADTRVIFTSPGGRTFRLEAKSELTDPVAPWTVVASGTTDASGTTTVADPGAAGQPRRFYRVEIALPPSP